MPEPDRTSESWSAQTKFAVVVETAALNEAQLAEYCRSKGLYPEQVNAWRESAIASQDEARQASAQEQHKAKGYRKQIKQLEREITRKNSALAEAAALLILQKKMRALWEGARTNDSLMERTRIIGNINTACRSGAALHRACRIAGVSLNCWYRWQQDGATVPDRRPDCVRPEPANKLSGADCTAILTVCNSERFGSLPPSQIVPILTDEGRYLASESSFYRVLRQAGQAVRRGRVATPRTVNKPTSHTATAPNQVWS